MPGPKHVACVEIGGIPISLSTTDEDFLDLLRQRYAGFLSSSRPEFELEFEILGPAARLPTMTFASAAKARSGCSNAETSGALGPAHRTGRVRQNANPYSLDSVLRILHSLILAERGGFLLHAASAICDGRAYLFSGRIGRGQNDHDAAGAAATSPCLPTKFPTFAGAGSPRRGYRHSALPLPESWPKPARTAPRRFRLYFFWRRARKTASMSCPPRRPSAA